MNLISVSSPAEPVNEVILHTREGTPKVGEVFLTGHPYRAFVVTRIVTDEPSRSLERRAHTSSLSYGEYEEVEEIAYASCTFAAVPFFSFAKVERGTYDDFYYKLKCWLQGFLNENVEEFHEAIRSTKRPCLWCGKGPDEYRGKEVSQQPCRGCNR